MTVLKWKWPIAGLILLIACVACLFALQQGDMVTVPFCVKVEAGGESETIVPWTNEDGTVYVFFPAYADTSKSTFQMKTTGEVYIQGVRLVDQMDCGSFQLDVPYEMTFSSWGKAHQRRVVFVQSAKVPTMYIDTESGSMEYIHAEKGNEEAGELRLYLADGSLSYAGEISDINGRGNNTWEAFEKKPYSVNLKEEADLLGMGAATKWILLANADDPSHMRNKIVFDFADDIGLAYSPDADWVDLYLNGEYAGLYLLSERNEVHSSRINPSSGNAMLFSMERTDRLQQQKYPHIRTRQEELSLRIHYPAKVSEKERKQIQIEWDALEKQVIQGKINDPEKNGSIEIDIDSWARKYVIEELFCNIDGGIISQYFYVADEGEQWKMYAGPVWDYDHSMGWIGAWEFSLPNTLFAKIQSQRFWSGKKPWYFGIVQSEVVTAKVRELYQQIVFPNINMLLYSKFEEYREKIDIAAAKNQSRWKTEDYEQKIEEIKEFLRARSSFLEDMWVNNTKYLRIEMDARTGSYNGWLAVRRGELVASMPMLQDTPAQTFLGWYYEGTDEPFDPSRPIYEDTAMYAKWKDTPYKRLEQVKKLLPAGVIAIMFLVILAADVRRMRKGR